ncbi:putative metal-nicotianamine transporter YSL7 [Acorus calamus]|uniref:Metal-nicotianamine transporter YSL7 n=1 Tax=Acorus calamus TaxID=4465 RepID=A0AAV9F6P0_ACOCL|nr:putative metal-nicotianamine transporter YSL7 [Acorus calamus]
MEGSVVHASKTTELVDVDLSLGGFGSYLLGMSSTIASPDEGYLSENIKEMKLNWMIGFLFVVSFIGLFSIVALRKTVIIDFKLTYPSGNATAHLINSFHTLRGAKIALKQVKALWVSFSISLFWSFFQWFFTGGDNCGFSSFPTFGLKAYANRFYFDFSAVYVGVGMLSPCMGLLFHGGSCGLSLEKGKVIGTMRASVIAAWGASKVTGPNEILQVFISIAMILGDGLYQFCLVVYKSAQAYKIQASHQSSSSVLPVNANGSPPALGAPKISYDDEIRTDAFLKDQIPTKFAITGYVVLALISTVVLPTMIFKQLKWYYVLLTYGKLGIFIFGAWAGLANGGVIAGLAACGVMMSIVSTASDLMQDFKTGYMTRASPKAMFVSQVVGTAFGCIIGPLVFWVFFKAFPLGKTGSNYHAPYAALYRGIALLGIEGLSSLPKHCVQLCILFFFLPIALNGARDYLKHKNYNAHNYLPNVMSMAIPFYLGPYFAIDMCLGSLILYVWERRNKAQADMLASALASGMICGDGIWSLPASVLSLAGVKPPMCMKFVPGSG